MKTKLFDAITLKFVLVGIVNTLVGNGVMFLLYNLFNCSFTFSTAANFIVGRIVSYFLNKYFTFKKKEKSLKEVIVFIINIAVCYILAYGIAKPLVYMLLSAFSLNLKDNIAMLLGSLIFIALNYISQRFIVFKKSN